VKLSDGKEAESDLSAEASIVPRDTFPPVAPKGVQASIAPNSIELNWERNTEDDLAGYRIYRSLGNAPLEKLTDTSAVPSYSDRKVEHGKSYRYAISAFDQAGNESPRSAPVEVAFP
jgi:fibronectin type 3 domain-containing protein